MIGQIVGELQPWLLGLWVGGAGDIQVKVGIGPYLSVRVKAWGSNRSLQQNINPMTKSKSDIFIRIFELF